MDSQASETRQFHRAVLDRAASLRSESEAIRAEAAIVRRQTISLMMEIKLLRADRMAGRAPEE